ncbi:MULTISPECIES: hypothetical protein [Pectinatus]|uniref:hypothetical protein n=1 Tax=Pectinatus TaxID=864 RepID=UPI0018C5385C|nr:MULTISPECIES: hypothetical protein [Pectinatus]
MNIYALYQGEEYSYTGTIYEIAEHQHIKISSLYGYGTPARKKRMKPGSKQKILIKLEKYKA